MVLPAWSCADTVADRAGSGGQPSALTSAGVHFVTIPVRVPEPGPYTGPVQAATRQGAVAATRTNATCHRAGQRRLRVRSAMVMIPGISPARSGRYNIPGPVTGAQAWAM